MHGAEGRGGIDVGSGSPPPPAGPQIRWLLLLPAMATLLPILSLAASMTFLMTGIFRTARKPPREEGATRLLSAPSGTQI